MIEFEFRDRPTTLPFRTCPNDDDDDTCFLLVHSILRQGEQDVNVS